MNMGTYDNKAIAGAELKKVIELFAGDIKNEYLAKNGNGSNVTSTFTKDPGDESSMASGNKLSAIFTAISGFFAGLLSRWREGINLRPGAVSLGYTHLGTMTVTDGNKRALVAFEVFCGRKAAEPHRIKAMIGVDSVSTVNAAYSSECVLSSSERNRFKLCYRFAADSTTETPKIEVWLVDTSAAGTSTRRCACNIHIVKGFTWTDGNTTTETLPANLVDFVLATRQGQLTILEGGTGASTAKGAEYNITPSLGDELTTVPEGTYKIPFLTSNPSASNGRFAGYRTLSTVWQYFKSQAGSLYAAISHTHTKSQITDFPSLGTAAGKDVGTGSSQVAVGDHGHGNITKDGKVGTSSGKPLITTTGGAVTAGAFGTSSGQFAEGDHNHGNITKDGKVGTSSGKPLITTTGGAVTAGEFGALSGQFAEGNHNHTHINGNANGYAKATGSAVRGLLDLGKFSYSSNKELSATFRISYTDARQYAPVEILLRLQIKYSGNDTDGIVSIGEGKFYAYKIRSGQNKNTTDYECYLRIIDGELHVLVGMTSTTTTQANTVVRCLWNVQSSRSTFTMLNEELTELPDYTSMIVVPKYHMAYADAAGANGAPVTVDKYGKLLPLDSIQATSVGYLRLDGTVSDFDTYSVMVMDADGVVYKDASAYKKLAYRAQDNCIGSNIDGWATMLEPKALSSIPSEAPDILHVPLLDSSRYVRTDQSSTPTRMVYSRSTNTLSVNVNGKVNGKTFVFGEYGGAANTVYFC